MSHPPNEPTVRTATKPVRFSRGVHDVRYTLRHADQPNVAPAN